MSADSGPRPHQERLELVTGGAPPMRRAARGRAPASGGRRSSSACASAERERHLRLAPGEMGEAAAGQLAEQGLTAGAGRGGSSATRCSKPSASSGRCGQRRPGAPPRGRRAARAHGPGPRGGAARPPDDEHRLAAESRSPATPAKPSPRLSRSSAGGARASSGRAVLARRRARRSSASQKGRPPPAPRTRLARAAERAQDHARLHHPVPAVALEPERDVVGSSAAAPASAAAASGTPRRASARPRRSTRVKRACWPSSPMPARARAARRARAASGCGLPIPNGREPLELLGEVEPEVAAGHDGVHALDRDQVVGRERRRRVGGQARGGSVDARGVQLHPGGHRGGRRSGSGAPSRRASPACRS